MIVFDYQSLEKVNSVSVGDDPHEIVTTPDGTRAYISIPLMNNNGHEIDVVNLKTLKPEVKIDTRPFYIPHGLVYKNEKLWFTAQGSKSVVVYDVNAHQFEEVFGT